MSNLEKLNKILSNQKSTWEDEAKWREQNEDWLSLSFDIAVRVLDTLRLKKMTQKDLAEKMKVSPQFINKVVKGQENLSLETIGKLSRALGIRLVEIADTETSSDVEYDFEQAYEVSQHYRKQIFGQASSQGYHGLEAVQVYVKEQKLEYKMPA
jgi:transcriptional regulator with XRE-family HTH domain